MAYIFMVLVSVANARPQAAREDAKILAVLKDITMADQAGIKKILFSRECPKALCYHLVGAPSQPSS